MSDHATLALWLRRLKLRPQKKLLALPALVPHSTCSLPQPSLGSHCPNCGFSYLSPLNSFKRERTTSFTDSTANGRTL
jgi:hypothetical protein